MHGIERWTRLEFGCKMLVIASLKAGGACGLLFAHSWPRVSTARLGLERAGWKSFLMKMALRVNSLTGWALFMAGMSLAACGSGAGQKPDAGKSGGSLPVSIR